MILTQKPIRLLEIPVTIRIIGDPVLVANKIFDGKKDHKTGELMIPQSILVTNEIECRLKEYQYRNEVSAPQDILVVFGVIDKISKPHLISEFLYEKLKNFRKISVIIDNKELTIDRDLINNSLVKMRIENHS